jgi:hypothetical protein
MKFPRTVALLITALALCLITFPSLAATLELHHALGEADDDGHQHSAADLCSWVQSHSSSSDVGCVPVLDSRPAMLGPETPHHDRTVEHLLLGNLPVRGPPTQLL